MRVTLKIVWDQRTGEVLEHDWVNYSGTWELCKGDDTLKASEKQQMAFSQQLQTMFAGQFGKQSAQLDYLNGILKPIVARGGMGLDPQTLASMRTGATDTIAQQYANAGRAVQNRQAQLGETMPSGVNQQIAGQLAAGQAQTTASEQQGITQYNQQVRQGSFWNAIQGLSGGAAMLNPQSYAGAANQSAGETANLGQAWYGTQTPGWLSPVLGALGGVGAAAATGGLSRAKPAPTGG